MTLNPYPLQPGALLSFADPETNAIVNWRVLEVRYAPVGGGADVAVLAQDWTTPTLVVPIPLLSHCASLTTAYAKAPCKGGVVHDCPPVPVPTLTQLSQPLRA